MNGLGKITIDGKEVGLKFGLPAIRLIVEKMAIFPLVSGEGYTELGFVNVLYAGYINDCAMHNRLPEIPFEKFYEYVEECEGEERVFELTHAILAFQESKKVQEIRKKKAPTNQSTGTN